MLRGVDDSVAHRRHEARLESSDAAAELFVPIHPGVRDRCMEPEKYCNETSAGPLQYFRIKVCSDDLNSGGDPHYAKFHLLFHTDLLSDACAACASAGESMQPRPISVASTASSSGVWGSRPRTAVKRALSIRTASRQR